MKTKDYALMYLLIICLTISAISVFAIKVNIQDIKTIKSDIKTITDTLNANSSQKNQQGIYLDLDDIKLILEVMRGLRDIGWDKQQKIQELEASLARWNEIVQVPEGE